MAKQEERVLCETPTPGKTGTRIAKWKYDAVRTAIRKVVPRSKPGVEFRELPELVAEALHETDRKNLGSLMWYVTTVKLHLETIGELERIEGSSPQRLRRVK